jgi:hypothetical protein
MADDRTVYDARKLEIVVRYPHDKSIIPKRHRRAEICV